MFESKLWMIGCLAQPHFINEYLTAHYTVINATDQNAPRPLCRIITCVSLHPHQKLEEKLAGVQKTSYLCIVKTEQQVLHDKQTIILTIKKYTTMYAIAFFTTVILFSASLYIGHKIADSVRNHKSSTTESDFVITPYPYIGAFRHSA